MARDGALLTLMHLLSLGEPQVAEERAWGCLALAACRSSS